MTRTAFTIPPSSCNWRKGITLLDYAYLSLVTYRDSRDHVLLGDWPINIHYYNELPKKLTKPGWYSLETFEVKLDKRDHFYAELYLKIYDKKIQHIAIAIRGTNNSANIVEDILEWGGEVLTRQEPRHDISKSFSRFDAFKGNINDALDNVSQYAELSKDIDIHITGHSLGGAVALACGFIRPGHQQFSVGFNPPGVGQLDRTKQYPPYLEGQAISVRASYDLVSIMGEPYGYVLNQHVKPSYHEAQAHFENAKTWLKNDGENQNEPYTLSPTGFPSGKLGALSNDISKNFSQSKHFLDQHKMSNMLQAICQNKNYHSADFYNLIIAARKFNATNDLMNHKETIIEFIA